MIYIPVAPQPLWCPEEATHGGETEAGREQEAFGRWDEPVCPAEGPGSNTHLHHDKEEEVNIRKIYL